ncbi:hypothetical protein WDQ79_005127 [Klebsiella michiganensis]|uniref:hypothetical protein n=1 Tax=Klebsiella michiganensis TaxID=1134687 RepID=UPI001F44AB43|nr:hypothetical protein [Klebsiella michiganensis]MCF0023462.1 hypothetical protein [Klebsiella michiganensis]
MATPIYLDMEEVVKQSTNKLIREQVDPWMNLITINKVNVRRFDGRDISLEGVAFQGTAVNLFWHGYIDPYLKDMINNQIIHFTTFAKQNHVVVEQALFELQGMLISSSIRVYTRMVDIDQRLRGNGHPHTIIKKPIEKELEDIKHYISTKVSNRVKIEKAIPWYEKPWLKSWPIIVTMLATIINLIMNIYSKFTS